MNTRSTHRRIVRCLAAALALGASIAAHAQQGFDQAPVYPSQPSSPPPTGGAYPPPQMPNPNPNPNQGHHGGAAFPQAGQTQPGQMQQGWPTPNTGGHPGAMPNPQGGNPLHALLQMELHDYGVPPQQHLQTQMHGPTPTSIPGGHVITTDRLLALYQQGQSSGLLVLHVLGQGSSLPMAQNAVAAAQAGDFQDQTQQQFGQYLQQVTQGNKGVPIVLYCQSTQCWMSYNAALRAIQLGYTQVYWYRGGIEAWQNVQQAASATMQQQDPSGYQNAGYRPPSQPGGW